MYVSSMVAVATMASKAFLSCGKVYMIPNKQSIPINNFSRILSIDDRTRKATPVISCRNHDRSRSVTTYIIAIFSTNRRF